MAYCIKWGYSMNDNIENQITEYENKEYIEERNDIEGNPNDEIVDDYDILENEVISYVGNYSLLEYSNKLNKEFIKPNFQRNEVWDNKAKSKLIESFLAAYPVPPVFLFKEKGKESYLIIDGFQRLSAIKEFFNNEFKLNVKNKNYRNKFYSNLSDEAKAKLQNTFLNCVIVREVEPSGKSFLYNLFERLNTGGKSLNAMEARRAISYGKLIQSLEELNKYSNWRKIIDKQNIDNRFLDLELLLRLLALTQCYDKVDNEIKYYINNKERTYSNMKTFLNDFVENNTNNTFDEFSLVFKDTCDLVINELGINPFKLNTTKPNYMILDSVMTAILILKAKISGLNSKFNNFKQTKIDMFEDKSGTLSSGRLKKRIKLAIEAFEDA